MNSRGEPASEFRRRLAFLLIGALGTASGLLWLIVTFTLPASDYLSRVIY
jgi:hypothetical protein